MIMSIQCKISFSMGGHSTLVQIHLSGGSTKKLHFLKPTLDSNRCLDTQAYSHPSSTVTPSFAMIKLRRHYQESVIVSSV